MSSLEKGDEEAHSNFPFLRLHVWRPRKVHMEKGIAIVLASVDA